MECFKMAIIILLLFPVFFMFTQGSVSSDDIVFPCQTPDAQKGFCVSIFDCPELIKLVYETGEKGANFAKESVCLGCVRNKTWVCCKQPKYTVPSLSSTTKPNISDVSESDDSLRIRKTKNLEKLNNNAKFCGQQHSAYRAGKPGTVEIDEYPWVVQIKSSQDKPVSMRCNGVIIEKNYILTTSKCGIEAYTVLLGQYNVNEKVSCKKKAGEEPDCTEPTKELPILLIYYSNNAKDDQYGLTLLKVPDITYNDYVRPICLPLNRTDLSTTEQFLQVSGWSGDDGTKKEVKYKTDSVETCMKIDEQLKTQVEEENISLMCLVAESELSVPYCAFDFGGPLMYQHEYNHWYLDGLISNGPTDSSGCSVSNITGIYLTPKLIDFIVRNIN